MYKTLKVIGLCNSHSAYLSPLQRKYKKIKRGNKELLHIKNTEFKVPILSKKVVYIEQSHYIGYCAICKT